MGDSVQVLLVAGAVVAAFLAGTMMDGGGDSVDCPSSNCVEPGFMAFYLYPFRCVECARGVGSDCDSCNAYYNPAGLEAVSEYLGVDIGWYDTRLVDKGSILVVGESELGLGVVENKFSVANTICRVANDSASCGIVADEVGRAKACVEDRGVSANTLVYHYTRGDCSHCDDTTLTVDQLVRDTGFNVTKVLHEDREDMRLINMCLSSFSARQYVPEVICPANGRSLVGRVASFTELEDFARACTISLKTRESQ